MRRITWSPTARKKLDEIIDFISRDNVDAAWSLVDKFEERVRHLKNHPRAGRIVPSLNDEKIRQIVVHSNYVVIYEINEDRIDILTIRHTKQDEDDSEIG